MANELTRLKVASMTWDFTVDGGAVSTVIPSVTEIIPNGAIITDVKTEVVTAVTDASGTSTYALTGGGVTLKAAESITNSVYGTGSNAIIDVIRAGNAASTGTAKYIPIVATSSAQLKLVIGTAVATAGKLIFYVTYIL